MRALLGRGAHVVGLVRDQVPGSELCRSGLAGRIDVVRGCVTDAALVERALAEHEIQTVLHLAAQTIVGIANRSPTSTFLRPGSAAWRLAGLEGRYTRHEADLHDAEGVRRAVAACRPAVVYHPAAHGTAPAQRDRAAVLGSNVLGTANLLQALDGQDYQALVHAGSSSENGHKDRPMREGDVLEPRTDYAVAKAAATHLCQAEALRGRPVSTVRIFSAYGPWEDPSRIASSVMASCLRGEAPGVTDGTQPRDFRMPNNSPAGRARES